MTFLKNVRLSPVPRNAKDEIANASNHKQHLDIDESSCNNLKISPHEPNSTEKKTSKSTSKPAIMVLGDQQVKGFAQKIATQRRSNGWNDIYSVTGITKPQATSKQILDSCNNIFENINKDDIIVLGLGANDQNPYLLISQICNTLKILEQNKVFLLNVHDNPFLNVHLLNQQLKLFAQNFKNCEFVDTREFFYDTKFIDTNAKNSICLKLNIEIDNIHLVKLLQSMWIANCKKPCINTSVNNNVTKIEKQSYVKGTIPYYFDLQRIGNNKPFLKSDTKLENQIQNQPKKGTIPYFFSKVATKNIQSSTLKSNKTDFFRQ